MFPELNVVLPLKCTNCNLIQGYSNNIYTYCQTHVKFQNVFVIIQRKYFILESNIDVILHTNQCVVKTVTVSGAWKLTSLSIVNTKPRMKV